jgi:hypothetical protein
MSHLQHAYASTNQWILKKLDTLINSPDPSHFPTFNRIQREFISFLPIEEFNALSSQEKQLLLNSVFEVYMPALLHLFFPANLAHKERVKTLWNELLTLPSGEKNFLIPLPALYQTAKKIILDPFLMPLEYQITRPLQKKMLEFPKLSFTATSILTALNPSIFSISLSLWIGLSLIFKTPKQHGNLTKNLWQIGQNLLLYSVIGSIIFPLIIKGLFENSFNLPLAGLYQLAGILLCNFLIELKTALNCYRFEQDNPYQIEGTPKMLCHVALRNIFSPLVSPTVSVVAVSTSLLLPQNAIIGGLLTGAKIYSFLNGAYLAIKLSKKKGAASEATQLILISLSWASSLLKLLKNTTEAFPACIEIEKTSLFGLEALAFPNAATGRYCHESSGIIWKAQPVNSPIARFFTAESLNFGYQIFPSFSAENASTPVSTNSSALIPWLDPSEASDPIKHFCELISQGHCAVKFRELALVHPALLVSYAYQKSGLGSPSQFNLVITRENQERSLQASATVFLALRGYQLYKNTHLAASHS